MAGRRRVASATEDASPITVRAGLASIAVTMPPTSVDRSAPCTATSVPIGKDADGLPIGVQLQAAILEGTGTAQRTGQAAGQLGDPEGRIQAAQIQGHLPAHALGEAQVDLALRPPLAGLEIQ